MKYTLAIFVILAIFFLVTPAYIDRDSEMPQRGPASFSSSGVQQTDKACFSTFEKMSEQ